MLEASLELLVKMFRATSEDVMKCGFSLENLQPAPLETSAPIVNLRYWSTDPYQTIIYFIV